MKAFLKNYRQSPRKVRLVADLIKGKDADKALVELGFLAKRASDPIKKLLNGAIANAKNAGYEKENLFVKEIRVDKGIVMKRIMPRAMGRASRINKRTSHVTLVLAEKIAKKKTVKKEAKVETKKEISKKEISKKENKPKVEKKSKKKE